MSKLIAMVATAVLIGGERTIIQPGQELPDLSEHDARELTASGAAENPADTEAHDKAEARALKEAEADFAAARKRVQQAQASTEDSADKPAPKATARK